LIERKDYGDKMKETTIRRMICQSDFDIFILED